MIMCRDFREQPLTMNRVRRNAVDCSHYLDSCLSSDDYYFGSKCSHQRNVSGIRKLVAHAA